MRGEGKKGKNSNTTWKKKAQRLLILMVQISKGKMIYMASKGRPTTEEKVKYIYKLRNKYLQAICTFYSSDTYLWPTSIEINKIYEFYCG